MLITTGEEDSRVDPCHARKLAARLQAATSCGEQRPILLRVESAAGHGQGKPTSKQVEERADVLAFLTRHLTGGLRPVLTRPRDSCGSVRPGTGAICANAWAEVEGHALGGGRDGDGGVGEAGDDGVELVVGAGGVVVEEQDRPGAGQLGQAHGVVGGRVAPGRAAAGSSAAVCWASWTSRSTSAARASAASWYGPQPSGPGPSADGAVVGQVGDRRRGRR